jgi:tRNA threonylcarbamoyl adenosine modification protein YjeE
VTSPTYTIGNRYVGRVPVSHLDLYRLDDGLTNEDPALLADYLTPDAIAFVEWPERAPATFTPTAEVHLAHVGGDRRTVEVR